MRASPPEQRSAAAAFFAWRPAGVGAVLVPCGWCEGAPGCLIRLGENLLEALCPRCANSLALGRARAIAREAGPRALRAALTALGLLPPGAPLQDGAVEGGAAEDGAGDGELLDRLIDEGLLRRDLRLVLELDPAARRHAYGAAPLRDVALPEEVEWALEERRRRGGVLSELVGGRVRERVAATVRSVGAEAGLERYEGGGARPELLPARVQALLRALPLRRAEDGALVVAVWDPLDACLLRDLERLAGEPVHAVLGAPEALRDELPPPLEDGGQEQDDEQPPVGWLGGEDLAGLGEDPVEEVLLEALEEGAGELLLEPREGGAAALRLRVQGELRDERRVPLEAALACAERLAPATGALVSAGTCRYELPGLPLRIDYRRVETPLGPALALRLEEEAPPACAALTLGGLGLSLEALATFEAALAAGRGLIVIGAPRAHERTEAYHAVLARALRLGGAVVSVERRVRRLLPATQIQVSAALEPGALDALLDPRPDWLGIDGLGLDGVLGREALRLGLDAVLAGGAAVVTVPALDAETALARLELDGAPRALLARAVSVVLVRRAVARACPHCRFPLDEGRWVGLGCAACAEQGRGEPIPLAELARVDERGHAFPCAGSEPLPQRLERLAREGAVARDARA
ncbi:MAG: hypothetical protein AB7N76_19780 [Planctomycetota bacterium]